MNDLDAGKLFIDTFLNSYKKANGVYISRDELMSKIYKYNPEIKFKEWGKNFKISMNANAAKLVSFTDYLAEKTKGALPTVDALSSLFYDSLPSTFEIYKEALSKSSEEIGEGLIAVGNAAIETGKLLTMLLPFIVIGVVGYALYTNKDLVKVPK
jgi:hypothetical protein